MPLPSSAFETHDACRLYRIPGIGQKTSVRKTRSGSLPFNAAWYTHSHNSFLFFSGKAIWNDSCLFYFHSNFDPNQSVQFWISWRESHNYSSSYIQCLAQGLVHSRYPPNIGWMNEWRDGWMDFFFWKYFIMLQKQHSVGPFVLWPLVVHSSSNLDCSIIILNHIFTPFLGFCVSLNFPLPI